MKSLDRRAFLASAGAFSLASSPQIAAAQNACVTSGLPPFLPNRLTVDCATRRNFAIYRRYPSYMGLAGCVSMTSVRGRYGEYPAGNLFLFPWLKKSGQALGVGRNWGTVMPLDPTRSTSGAPIPNWQMPLDEYFLRYKIEAPIASFIGFRADALFNLQDARRPWFTNVDKLADGKGIGIAWTSSNLNGPWFAGNHWIPNSDDCKGNAWRKLIIDGINQASANHCAA
jgi:hypothetical protein